jgi:hypothetical protein
MTRRSARAVPFVALNCAFDPGDARRDVILDRIAAAVAAIHDVVEVKVFAHHPTDEHVVGALARAGVRADVVRLYGVASDLVLRSYSNALFTIGMRGRSQRIPFGCGRPIVSLVSRESMWSLLDDIDHRDWGVAVDDAELVDRLAHVATHHLDHLDAARAQARAAQDSFWDVTRTNLHELGADWGLAPVLDLRASA